MIQYLKLLIISFISSLFIAMPASSSGHFAYLNNVLSFTDNKNDAVFYSSIITLVFSITSLFVVRKLFRKGFNTLGRNSDASEPEKDVYRNMFVCVIISVISGLIMLVPYGKGKILSDIFGGFLISDDMLVVSAASVLCGVCSFVAIWYSKQQNKEVRRSASKSDAVRMTIYSSIASFIPGFSRFSAASNSLIVSGIDENSVIRDTLLYTTPATLTLSIIRIVRCIIKGVAIDPIMIAICAVVSLLGSILILALVRKVNIKQLIVFFSIYSIIFGFGAVLTMFLL